MSKRSEKSVRVMSTRRAKCQAMCRAGGTRQADSLLLVRKELRQVFQTTVQVSAQLVQYVGADHGPVLVEHFRKRSPIDLGGVRHFLKADPALLAEFLVGDLLLQLESDHFRRSFKKINKRG